MSPERVPVDDPGALRSIMVNAEALLLDFDGPVCGVFAGFPAHLVAHQLRGVLADGGHDELPAEVEKAEDPFDVLRYAVTLGPNEARYVEAAMRAHEVDAVATARPTPGAHELIRAWHASGRKLAVVSNNSVAAVEAYLKLHKLMDFVDAVSARVAFALSLLKPNPHLVIQAADELGVASAKCVLVGDSLTDIQAAHAAGAPVIGYANRPDKVAVFVAEVPWSIVTEMRFIESVVR